MSKNRKASDKPGRADRYAEGLWLKGVTCAPINLSRCAGGIVSTFYFLNKIKLQYSAKNWGLKAH